MLMVSWELSKLVNEKDGIWTAEDADLRAVEITSLGMSGVALLRRASDRRFAVKLSYVSFMLQVAFLYFIVIYDVASLTESLSVIFVKTPALLFCSLFINTMSCCASMIMGAKAIHTPAPDGYATIHKILVALNSFILPFCCICTGTAGACVVDDVRCRSPLLSLASKA